MRMNSLSMLSRIYIKNLPLLIPLKYHEKWFTGHYRRNRSWKIYYLGASTYFGRKSRCKINLKAEEKCGGNRVLLNNQFKKFFIENDLDYELRPL
jgi:DNA repair protein RecN (Recombination protein N)